MFCAPLVSEERIAVELSSDGSVKQNDAGVDVEKEATRTSTEKLRLSTVSSEDTGSRIPASEDPGCLGTGCVL